VLCKVGEALRFIPQDIHAIICSYNLIRRQGGISPNRPAESPGVTGVFFDWIVAGSTLRHTTLSRLSAPISSAMKPNSAGTSSVCSPNSGGRAAILLGVRDSVTGWPTRRLWRPAKATG
jgi:hypothetical protein